MDEEKAIERETETWDGAGEEVNRSWQRHRSNSSHYRVVGPASAGLKPFEFGPNTASVALNLQRRMCGTTTHLAQAWTVATHEVIVEQLQAYK